MDEFLTISYGACNPYILDNRVKSSFVLSGVARGPEWRVEVAKMDQHCESFIEFCCT